MFVLPKINRQLNVRLGRNGLKNVCEKNHISLPLHPIDLKFGMVVDFMNIYHQKNFEKFLEPFKNLYFQKKIDFSALFEPIFMKFGGVVNTTKIYHQKFVYNFWRQI